jgi:hypothetical protein
MVRRILESSVALVVGVVLPAVFVSRGWAIDFATIRNNMNKMTSIAWDDYTKSLKGQHVNWTGWGVRCERTLAGGYKILIDMDPPGSASVQDVYIETFRKTSPLNFRRTNGFAFPAGSSLC